MFDCGTPQSAIDELRQVRADFLAAEAVFAQAKADLSPALGLVAAGADDDLLESFVRDLIRSAEQTLAPAGCAVTVDHEEFESALVKATGWQTVSKSQWDHYQPLIPRISAALLEGTLTVDACWSALQSTLSSQKTIDQGYAAVAVPLARTFSESLMSKVRRVGGLIAISHSVYTEANFNSGRTLSYRCAESFEKTIDQLAQVAEWAGMDSAADIRRVGSQSIGYNSLIESREKFLLGGGILLITFKSRFEYRVAR